LSAIKLSDCVGRIKEYTTLAITAKAARYKSEGKDIIGLAAGEPDFDTLFLMQERQSNVYMIKKF
jgi:aspartate aminotransferase